MSIRQVMSHVLAQAQYELGTYKRVNTMSDGGYGDGYRDGYDAGVQHGEEAVAHKQQTINDLYKLVNELTSENKELRVKADCPKGWHYSEVVAIQEKYDDACGQLTKAHEIIDRLEAMK